MLTVDELETPAVLVDLDVLERNVATMAARARAAGVRLRPHAKTHKCPEIGRMQLAAGAPGLTLAKISEAEVFAASGLEDVFVAFPAVGEDKGRRLLALSERARVSVGVDSLEGAQSLARPFARAGRVLDVLLKIDVGYGRVGVVPAAAAALARLLAELPGLRLVGIFTHAGHVYAARTPEDVAVLARHEGRAMVELAEALRRSGLPVEVVSVGSTPTARGNLQVPGVTECRPGSYVFHDANQVSLGACTLDDCALTVLTTVVSTPGPGRAVLDAGSKTLSSDSARPVAGGHGWVLGSQSRLSALSEEHGWVTLAEGDELRVGQRVRVLPNHCCAVANLHDRLFGVRAGQVEVVFDVAARGCVR